MNCDNLCFTSFLMCDVNRKKNFGVCETREQKIILLLWVVTNALTWVWISASSNSCQQSYNSKHNITCENCVHQYLNILYIDDPELRNINLNVSKIIETFKNNKALGQDSISNFILKKLPNSALSTIRRIFNAYFQTSNFSIEWKAANILVFLIRGKNSSSPSNYTDPWIS